MEKLSPNSARTRLDRVPLTVPDRALLATLLRALDDQAELSVERAHEVLFPGRTPVAATKALERLVKKVNGAAEVETVDLRLEVSGAKKLGARGRVLGFVAQRVDQPRDPLRSFNEIGDALILDRPATLIGPRRVVLCHAPQDAELAGRLWDLLTEALACGQAQITVWRPDNDVLAGDDRAQHFRTAAAQADLAVVALSNAWLGQTAAHETLFEGTGLKIVPVRLQALSPLADPAGFGSTPFPDDADGKPFEELRGAAAKRSWANGLADQIQRLLSRHAPSPPDMGLRDLRLLKADSGNGYFALDASRGAMEPTILPGSCTDARRVNDVVSFLLNWAHDPDGTPLAALLGEYGAGKTITCQELTERLRGDNHPEPLYFDLRRVGNVSNGVPTLTEILTECVARGWESGDARLPTGEEVIARARSRPTLFVIDGLDEVLVRLDAAQGVTFTHELLKLRPIRTRDGIRAPFAGKDTKVLLSCRTHYFRSLREQSRHFLEHDRDLSRAEDYTALILLPLTDKQIHDYLDKTLDRDATQVMDMLRAVHDLSDLATRPYTLAKVAAQVPFIERRLSEQRSVHAATIYQQVLHDWLARDSGKHHLRPDHKLKLMARLAAWSWRRGDRRVDSGDLDDWLDEQLATDDVLQRRYRNVSRDQLEEDLRTATFVVRSDDNGPDRPDFQFAHSSIHEYFLAQHLCDALRDDRRDDWRLPMPSDETLDFLGQLIADADDQAALTRRLAEWRAPYVAEASELWLRYHLRAREHEWPHSTIAACDLTGASLRHWRFRGTETAPLNLTTAVLAGADLRDTRWDHVTLRDANLHGANLERAMLNHSDMISGDLSAANLKGVFLRQCRLEGADLSGADTHAIMHVGPDVTLPAPPPPSRTRLQSRAGRSDALNGVAFSADGTRVAVGSGQAVRIWDATTGDYLVTYTGHTGMIHDVLFSPDGTRLATTSHDHTARIWDATTGEQLLILNGHTDWVRGAAFSPDGSRLATTSHDHTARIWDTVTGEHLLTLAGRTRRFWDVAFSPDGTRLATTGSGMDARIWDATTGVHLLTLTGHTGVVHDVAFSPDGLRLSTSSGDDSVHIWDAVTGDPLLRLDGHGNSVWAARFSPDGSRVASASLDRTSRVWDAVTGEELLVLTGHSDEVYDVVFSPDGTRIATNSADHTTHVWDSTTGEHLHTLASNSELPAVAAFSPDGARLASTGDDKAHVWNTVTGAHLLTLTGHTGSVNAVAFSPDGARLVTTGNDQTVRLWDSPTGEQVRVLTGHASEVNSVAFSPDGTRLATIDDEHFVRVWDSSTGEHLLMFDCDGSTMWVGKNAVIFSPDGARLVTTGQDECVRIWDSGSGDLLSVLDGETDWVWTAAFSQDGRRLATDGADGTASVWDPHTGERLLRLSGHAKGVQAITFSPDGRWLATGDGDSRVRLWDSTTGKQLFDLDLDHSGEVRTLTFSPDGRQLATACDDGTTRVWDIAGHRLLWLAAQFPDGAAASWSPADDRLIATIGDVWRYLRAACYDSQGRVIGVQPYERYYSLPESQNES
ncbi:pentapeptide repeat-containing protein [Lentzea sp. BCCO 10_0856]|uniref:Pentapeptide repeat-containing protein n=1 Tax=Lentzea miocenica TaxID=3095431 RepID=A0ABU4TC24_9PSEU|nr:pentapeptide repeat-containing protein [Lentzea sp. BCCO 10_0856]MDX8035737.1 pentapeptide repeat-containing protein [Lentzea sp. BCCO 10_0856]